jgi:hypothetical protein
VIHPLPLLGLERCDAELVTCAEIDSALGLGRVADMALTAAGDVFLTQTIRIGPAQEPRAVCVERVALDR